jgi:hypothetical protein
MDILETAQKDQWPKILGVKWLQKLNCPQESFTQKIMIQNLPVLECDIGEFWSIMSL